MALTRPARDAELVQIVDQSLADATARAGAWLACRPGCAQCCHGVFAISALDALRLRDGLATLSALDPDRASRVQQRAQASVQALAAGFPGNAQTGILGATEADAACFNDFANDEPCPALDPSTGTCDLYAARPLTCRIFGPPVLSADGLGMCELCFVGAPLSSIAAAELHLAHSALEDELTEAVEQQAHSRGATVRGATIVAYALLP